MTDETLFQEALSRSPAERAAYLDAACAGKPELRAAVEALLAAHEKSDNVLDKPPAELGQTVDSEPGEPNYGAAGEHVPHQSDLGPSSSATTDYRSDVEPGTVIAARYTLVEKIGEGGMGEVWVAKQTEPVKRKVALKLIKAGMDSRAVLQRFEQERQALAMMDHPNIARVLDGGLTADRRPFFVMELVNGLPLTKFCDEAKLGIRERLELFTPICQAVQHAHQKGIIHRDLKPANILVTIVDGRGVPKIIDFGVAKAVGGKLTDESLSTQFGAVVGTLEYMSPEQAGFSGIDVDTRADVYSLGVILYELLTGLKPHDSERLRKAALTEMIRIIQQEEPSKPSTRLSTNGSLPSLAALRQTVPGKLTAMLRGDLDWVVMKCLEKQRDRRYETANALARDIQRYLADEAVEARPPSFGYRTSKFLRRYKGPAIAASLVLATLVLGIVGTTWGLFEARRQQWIARNETIEKEKARRAETERAESERLAKEQAQQRLRQVEKGNEILGSIFESLDPKEIAMAARPLQAILVENLDQAVAQLEGESIGDPLVVAAMQVTFGTSLFGLGEPGKAIVLLEKALATYKARLGPEHPDTLRTMNSLAGAYSAVGKVDLALSLLEEMLKQGKAQYGPDHPNTFTGMHNLAVAYHAAGKPDLAVRLLEETLRVRKANLGPDHPDTLWSMHNLAAGYRNTGRLDLALALSEETLMLRKATLGPEHPETIESMNSLAAIYWSTMQLDKSIPLFEQTLKLAVERLGRNHPSTQLTVANLGVNYKDAGRLTEALPLLEEAHESAKKHHTLGFVGARLVDAYAKAGENEKLANFLRQELPESRRRLDSRQLAGLLAQIGQSLLDQNKWLEAEPHLRESLTIRETMEPDDWQTFYTHSLLGGALLGQKKYVDAEPLLQTGYERMKNQLSKIPPHGRPRLTEALERLVELYEALDKKDDAAKWRAELESVQAARQPVKQP